MATVAEKIRAARSARGEELWGAIKSQHPDALSNATLNRHLVEEMAVYIARSRNTPEETLGFLAGDVRFRDSYRLKLALARNPKCPQRVSLSLIKFLRLFDLADISRNQSLPAVFRRKVEYSIMEKMPAMASGIKTALAKRASAAVVVRLMERGDRKVINACLESPMMTEEEMRRLVNMPRTKPDIIRAVAESPKWSLRYPIKYGLIRNPGTPLRCAEKFIEGMKTFDLQELLSDPRVPPSTRPFIHAELKKRDAPLEPAEDEVYELRGDEDRHLEEGEEF